MKTPSVSMSFAPDHVVQSYLLVQSKNKKEEHNSNKDTIIRFSLKRLFIYFLPIRSQNQGTSVALNGSRYKFRYV